MTINMNDSHIGSIAQIQEFIKVSQKITFQRNSRKETYQWVEDILNRFTYFSLTKKDKSIIKKYILTMSGYSDAQLTRLICMKRRFGKVFLSSTAKHKFPRKYTAHDVALLIETDTAHSRLSGPATKKILKREYEKYGKQEYIRLKDISPSHIYNLRGSRHYESRTKSFHKTHSVKVPIGSRRKPDPRGEPGYLRVDSVHQGDWDKSKGVYHINLVDEVTQWEIVVAVEKISEYHLIPALTEALTQFPFTINNFHSDNGSEFINGVVSRLLNKLLIEQTKSRPRHSNDNGLAETKNASVIRKYMGHNYINQKYAKQINSFYTNYLNEYLNYHRPCGFVTIITDKKGKIKKVYRPKDYMPPFEKFSSLKNHKQFLKFSITMKQLIHISQKHSDNQSALIMKKAKQELFKKMKN